MKIKFETNLNIGSDNLKQLITPKPLKKILPSWYINFKRPNAEIESHPDPSFFSFIRNKKSIKNCMPVHDYITSGYVIPAWEQMYLEKDHKGVLLSKTKIDLENNPPKENKLHNASQFMTFANTNVFDDYYGFKDAVPVEDFNIPKLMNPWTIITPENYSCIFMRPFYHEQKINILPGIVDTDTYTKKVNFPFLINLKENQKYIINVGDPLIYVFPFKRDEWEIEVNFEEDYKNHVIDDKLFIYNYYKKFIRKEKKYN